MPKVTPDLSQVGPIAAGTYKAKIIACEVKQSKAGNPMIVPEFEISVNGTTRTRSSYIVITGAGARPFGQLLRACGFDQVANELADPAVTVKPEFDTDDLIGQELVVEVQADTYNNEPSDKIASYMKA